MKIAFATTDGNLVNEHFGRAGTFSVYEINANGYSFVESRSFGAGVDQAVVNSRGMAQEHDSAVNSKVERLADCKLIYLTEIGGPSAARLVKKGIMPMKVKDAMPIATALQQLQQTMKQSPPPWLRKAMGNTA